MKIKDILWAIVIIVCLVASICFAVYLDLLFTEWKLEYLGVK